MKDFAKSIVCNTKVGNKAEVVKDGNVWVVLYAEGTKSKEFDSEAEAKKFAAQVGNSMVGNAYQYAGSIPIEKIPDNWRPEFPKAGYVVYYAPNKAKWFATEAEAKRFAESQDKAQKTGNSKCGNAIKKFGLGSYVIADGHKAVVLGETEERGPNGIPFGWVSIRWVEGPWVGQSDEYYDYDLKKA